uniref:Uncharacterized protein n=1 Tax=Rhizophora mucronata TaxID=61149 RepID=A0A2P2PUM5_RHIMU
MGKEADIKYRKLLAKGVMELLALPLTLILG